MPDALRAYLMVAVGGALGSVGRFALQSFVGLRVGTQFPWGTLGVNLLGCTLMGLLVGATSGRAPVLVLFLGTGVLGGFTTYSAFNQEVVLLASRGEVLRAGLYVAATLLGALALGGTCFWLGRMLGPGPLASG